MPPQPPQKKKRKEKEKEMMKLTSVPTPNRTDRLQNYLKFSSK